VVTIVLAACGAREDKKATQPAAKVNNDEVTVQQINFVLSRAGQLSEQQTKEGGKRVLEQLINQQLLVQQATEKKLDQEPRVLQAIEAAKRQVLAQAYLEQVASGANKPTPEQITEFYDKHPELFAQRKLYRFNQLVIAGKPEFLPTLRSKLEEVDKVSDKSGVMRTLATWLQSQGVKFRAAVATQSAEQLPLEALPKFHAMKVGDLMLLPAQGGFSVLQLAASQAQAMDQEKAKPFIEQFLLNRARLEVTQSELKKLRESAKIEYLGDFKQAAADGKAGAQAGLPEQTPPGEGSAPTATPGHSESAQPPVPSGSGKTDEPKENGIKGHK